MIRLILWLFFRKEINEMAVIYATLIIKGKKVITDVPEKIREQVKDVLIACDCPELAVEA